MELEAYNQFIEKAKDVSINGIEDRIIDQNIRKETLLITILLLE